MLWSRFLEEAQITGQLEHPNIVPVYELVRPADGHQPFYTMRFVKGRTLTEAIRAYHDAAGRARPARSTSMTPLNAFVGVCNAVAYAHSRGVIHRDLKGQNVVLGDFGEVIVLDWGLAKLVDRPEETLTPAGDRRAPTRGRDATMQGQALGTPAYMAPEQAEGRGTGSTAGPTSTAWGRSSTRSSPARRRSTGDDTAEVLRKVSTRPPRRPGLDPTAPRRWRPSA